MKKFVRHIAMSLIAGLICLQGSVSAQTDQTIYSGGQPTVLVQGVVVKNSDILTVTVPIQMMFRIDPNALEDYVYESSAHEVQNFSNQAVGISLLGIKAEEDTPVKVVSPDTFSDWNNISAADTMSKIALGVRFTYDILWSPSEENNKLDTPSGTYVLNANTMDSISISAKFGRAWTKDVTLNYIVYLRIAFA